MVKNGVRVTVLSMEKIWKCMQICEVMDKNKAFIAYV